jgi:hypothetical protein
VVSIRSRFVANGTDHDVSAGNQGFSANPSLGIRPPSLWLSLPLA